MNTVLEVPKIAAVKVKCLQCTRFFHPLEVKPPGLCFECLDKRFRSWEYDDLASFQRDGRHVCFDCQETFSQGFLHWDNLALRFAYLCLKCSDKAHQKDCRGTAFAYKVKAQ